MLGSLRERAHALVRHANTPLPAAMATPISTANDFFASPEFEAYGREREAEQKLALAVLNRIDGVARQVNALARMLAKKPSL